ncbi:MAG: hypothetical protein LUG60_04310 [Erysipelotrichaceae bacterium]|nr:hypothetical protein [Erysipelotrichaceae bacterium]
MKIYRKNDIEHILLNPDEYYNDHDICSKLYDFYKSFDVSQNIDNIIGIHIRYEIQSYLYEMHPYVYRQLSSIILETVKHYFNNDNAYMYFDDSDYFYIVLFNETEENICHQFEDLYHECQRHMFKCQSNHYRVTMKAGIYFAKEDVNAYYLYDASKNTLEKALKHHQTYMSVSHY